MSEFIKVTKGDEIIEISPLALADHKRLGWILWDEQAQAAAERKAVEEKAEADSKAAIDKAVADAQAVQAKAAADAKVPAGKKAAVSPSKGNS